jgi:AraC family transcriptional regulator of adaptative response / DNA-3-methyladenine glycosylase II
VKGATTLCGRLVQAFGSPLRDPSDLTHLFPSPEALADADVARIGLPRARAESIRTLARAVVSGRLSLDPAASLADQVTQLTAMPGIGDWTAQYIAMRAFGETDALPASDIGLRRALARGRALAPREVSRLAEAWRPWRAYAVMLLWLGTGAAGAPAAGPGTPARPTMRMTRTGPRPAPPAARVSHGAATAAAASS